MVNEESRLRLAMSLIQEAKDALSPMNDDDKILWNATCDLELVRSKIEGILTLYLNAKKGGEE